MEPKIGIVICGFTENRQFVTNPYIQSVRYSKGLPIILPLVRSDRLISEYVKLCDGFLFCGGGDITPLLFGEEPRKGNGSTDITVDLFQIRLMKQILRSRKPVLAICRGIQILSVACGGTIWQDLSLIPGSTLDHMQQSASRGEVRPSDPHRAGKSAPKIHRFPDFRKQLSSPGRQQSRKRCPCQCKSFRRNHRSH